MHKSYSQIIGSSFYTKSTTLNLFNSEGFFWITSAVSLAFAAEEIKETTKKIRLLKDIEEIKPWGSEGLIAIFKESLQAGEVSKENIQKSQEAACYNVKLLTDFSRKHCRTFRVENSIVVGKAFFAYWLIYKIIELEWQQVLDIEEINETYALLDAFIEDSQELAEIETQYLQGKAVTNDERTYLKTHWERTRLFWSKLDNDLELMAGGWLPFCPSYKR